MKRSYEAHSWCGVKEFTFLGFPEGFTEDLFKFNLESCKFGK